MDLRIFLKRNRKDWEELDQALRDMTKRKTILHPQLLDHFQRLYQKTVHHLSFSQTYFPNEEVTSFLNELVSKAHNVLYRDQTTSIHQLKHFFTHTFIRLLMEQWRFVLVASLLFMIGATGSFFSVMNDPLHLYSVLPDEIAYGVDPEQLGSREDAIDSPSMSASIMTNNIQVAFLAFAGGITLGVLTLYMLIYNGIIIGALAALFWQYSKSYEFWAYIVPHGIIELTAIFIAGGSGLLMGYRVLVPGRYPRMFQLKRQAWHSVQLLLGTIPLFVVAGIIEGFITPAPISLEAKYAFALLTLIGLYLYIWAGRKWGKRNPSTTTPDS